MITMNTVNFLKHPKDQRYYQIMAYVMGLVALNAQYLDWFDMPQNIIYRFHRKSVFFAVPLAVISQTTYLIVNQSKHEFEELLIMYAILPVTLIMAVKIATAQTDAYKETMRSWLTKIHLFNYYATNHDEYVKETLIKSEKLIRWSVMYTSFFYYSCCLGFQIVPIVRNLQTNESIDNITTRLEICVHFWLPFDYQYNFYNYVVVQICCVYCGFATITIIVLFDSMSLGCMYHIIGHIKIFKHRIKTMFSDDMTQEEVTSKIIDISRCYTFITETIKDMENAFGLNVAAIYMHNLIGGGLFIYQISLTGTETGTILTYGLMIPAYMGILVIVSFALEYIRIVGNDIPDVIYGINWESMSVSNQKLLFMVLCQVQPVLEFNAACNIKTGVQPAIDIFKTTFSFYVMIKSTV